MKRLVEFQLNIRNGPKIIHISLAPQALMTLRVRAVPFCVLAILQCLLCSAGWTQAWVIQAPSCGTAAYKPTCKQLPVRLSHRATRGPVLGLSEVGQEPETDSSKEWDKWGTGPLSHIEPVFRPPAEAESIIPQVPTHGCLCVR
eukprot:2400212-Rhodomonas_salina.1